MSVRLHPREMGATITCNVDCGMKLVTGQVAVGLIRGYAKSRGWIRGGRQALTEPQALGHLPGVRAGRARAGRAHREAEGRATRGARQGADRALEPHRVHAEEAAQAARGATGSER